MRTAVGLLGERSGWWTSHLADPAALRSLQRLFPRTSSRAAVESLTEAARRVHDAKLGPNTFHLFRLPPAAEDAIRDWEARPDGGTGTPWSPAADAAIRTLLAIGEANAPEPVEGPMKLGPSSRLRSDATLAEVGRIYLAASDRGILSLPYFYE